MNNDDSNDFALLVKVTMDTVAESMPLVKKAYDEALKSGFNEEQAMKLACIQFKMILGIYNNLDSDE